MSEAFIECADLGVNVDGYKLKDLRFADDIALIAESAKDLQTLLNKVHTTSKKYGMEISIQKTKAMVFDISSAEPEKVDIKIDNISLEQVDQFKYLGVTLTPSNDSTTEINHRLMLASTVLGKLQRVWKDDDVSLRTKLRLVNALVYPVLLYGAEVWTIKKADQNKLEAFEMRCYRKVLNISWQDKIRNDEVLARISRVSSPARNIISRIKDAQLSWFGHVARMDNNRLPKRIMLETVSGKNRKGRPRKHWENDIISGQTFYFCIQNRDTWKDYIHGANVLILA